MSNFEVKVIDVKEEINKLKLAKQIEFKTRLKLVGLDLDQDDIKDTEKKVKMIENILRTTDINFIDMYYTKEGESKPMLTENNVELLLVRYHYNILYDEIKNNIFLYDKNNVEKEIKEIGSYLEDEITRLNFQSRNFEVLNRKLNNIAFKNKINPVRDYILNAYEEKKDIIFNGDLEIDRLFYTIKGNKEDTEINYKLFKTWMISTVACIFNPEFKSQGCLTFTGSQGMGKSTWFSRLVPPELKKYFKEEFALNTTEKDNYMESVKYWIVELSELGRTIKDSDKVKSHICKEYDEYRAPYERSSSKHKRMTVYGASVDKDEFLRDDVNRRWWTIKINNRFDMIDIDYKKLYAELYYLYLQNPKKCHELDWNSMQDLNKHNIQFSVSDDCDSIIQNLFNWESNERYYISSNDIGILIDKERINNYRIGISLKKLNVKFDIFDKKSKQKMYYMPPVRKIKKDKYQLFLEMKYERVYENDEREGIKND